MEKTRKHGRQYVLRLLAIRDCTEAELKEKLRKKGFNEEVITCVITEMQQLGYVDDTRYAMHFAKVRATYDKLGPGRILLELKKRGIPKDLAETATRSVFPEGEEEANAFDLATRWIARNCTDEKDKSKRRLYGYLARRGFTPNVIMDTLSKVLK